VSLSLLSALRRVPAPPARASTADKRAYSDALSREFTSALGRSLITHFPRTSTGGGRGTNAASARGIKSVDVAFNIEGLFLGLGISVKVVGKPEAGRGFTHNLKRVSEEWGQETTNYHRYMPYSIIVGALFLPTEALDDRTHRTSLATTLEHFHGQRGRGNHQNDLDTMEEIYIGLFEADGPANGGRHGWRRGEARFISAEEQLAPRALPTVQQWLSFDDVKDHLVWRFKQRNPKLRVQGMP
jgi:hypothetical protein